MGSGERAVQRREWVRGKVLCLENFRQLLCVCVCVCVCLYTWLKGGRADLDEKFTEIVFADVFSDNRGLVERD